MNLDELEMVYKKALAAAEEDRTAAVDTALDTYNAALDTALDTYNAAVKTARDAYAAAGGDGALEGAATLALIAAVDAEKANISANKTTTGESKK